VRFLRLCHSGSPGKPGVGSRFVGVENRASGECADDDAVAWNHLGRQPRIVSVTSWPVRQWRIGGDGARSASKPDLPLRQHAANRSPSLSPPGEPPPPPPATGPSDCSRRERREREKRLGSVPSAAAVTRHRRTPQLVIDPIVHSCADHFSRRRYRQHARGRAVFPRRRTGAKAQPCRRRWSAYVESPGSRGYKDPENALIARRLRRPGLRSACHAGCSSLRDTRTRATHPLTASS